MVVMAAFCIQGDNIPDAVTMADRLQSWLNINQSVSCILFIRDLYYKLFMQAKKALEQQWIHPSSWSLMYGGPSPSNLF